MVFIRGEKAECKRKVAIFQETVEKADSKGKKGIKKGGLEHRIRSKLVKTQWSVQSVRVTMNSGDPSVFRMEN